MNVVSILLSFLLGATSVILLEIYAITGLIDSTREFLRLLLPGLNG